MTTSIDLWRQAWTLNTKPAPLAPEISTVAVSSRLITLDGLLGHDNQRLENDEVGIKSAVRPRTQRKAVDTDDEILEDVVPFANIANAIAEAQRVGAPVHILDANYSPWVPTIPKTFVQSNREEFISFSQTMLKNAIKGSTDDAPITCEAIAQGDQSAQMMTHQKITRTYMDPRTPIRGVILMHGLGAGKTRESIEIAEASAVGTASVPARRIVIMLPASLERGFIEEVKRWGDPLFRSHQHWEWKSLDGHREWAGLIGRQVGVKEGDIIKAGGAWLVDQTKPSNYNALNENEKASLNKQIERAIRSKYYFVRYNGRLSKHMRELKGKNEEANPFDDSCVVIDEAHNVINRIVNKLTKTIASASTEDTISTSSAILKLYRYLMSARNVKIVMLSGTPIINHPIELCVMFNILRGYIRTWTITTPDPGQPGALTTHGAETIADRIRGVSNAVDYVNFDATRKQLTFTRLPHEFEAIDVKKAKETLYGYIARTNRRTSNDQLQSQVKSFLEKNDIRIVSIKSENMTAFPDHVNEFNDLFVKNADTENPSISNPEKFSRRMLGLVSYFRSAQEELMPRYDEKTDMVITKVPMSNYQFGVHENARKRERNEILNRALNDSNTSSYRIASRRACTFAMPESIERPTPKKKPTESAEENGEEDDDNNSVSNTRLMDALGNAIGDEERAEPVAGNEDILYSLDELEEDERALVEEGGNQYARKLRDVYQTLVDPKNKFLTRESLRIYSPKYLEMLNNIVAVENRGLHLIYSQFLTLEGIGLFAGVLENNRFAQLRLHKVDSKWRLNVAEKDRGKPLYGMFTGVISAEQRELVRRIFNSEWEKLPDSLVQDLRAHAQISDEEGKENLYGEICRVLMITAAGSEGINLKNVRVVHIMEPYWNMVRDQQVVGRARRICSHAKLPVEMQTVKVYVYVAEITKEQIESEQGLGARGKDASRLEANKSVTSDEHLREISLIKNRLNQNVLDLIKNASVDRAIHSGARNAFILPREATHRGSLFAYMPSYKDDLDDITRQRNVRDAVDKYVVVERGRKKYAQKVGSEQLFDFDALNKKGELIPVSPPAAPKRTTKKATATAVASKRTTKKRSK